MEIAIGILSVGIIIFIAHFFSGLFEKIRIPDVLILVFIGFIFGPLTKLVPAETFGKLGNVFTTITLVVILFEGGLGLNIETIRKSMGRGMRLTAINFIGTLAVVATLATIVLKMSILESLMLGTILSATAPAIVIPVVRKLSMKQDSSTTLILESVFSEVFTIVITLALIQAFKYHALEPTLILGGVISSFMLAGIIGAMAAFFWAAILENVRKLENPVFLTPAFVFITFGVSEMLGYSGAIAVFVFGIILGNIKHFNFIHKIVSKRIKKPQAPRRRKWFRRLPFATEIEQSINLNDMEKMFLSEIVFLLKTFFFIYIGLSIQCNNLTFVILGLVITMEIFLVRIPVVQLAMSRKTTKFDASIISVMVPKGLAAAVLASLPLQAGTKQGAVIQEITYVVLLVSIVLATMFVFLIEKTGFRKFHGSMFPGYAETPEKIEKQTPPTK